MTSAGWIALAIAVFGSFCYAAGSILQAVGARRSKTTVRALGHPLYLIGVLLDLVAFAGSMVALRELAVYLVESVLAGSLAVTVVAARIFLKARLRRRDVAAVIVSVAALTVLAMSAGPQESVAPTTGLKVLLCAAAVGLALIGWGTTKTGSPGAVAAVAGLMLGGAALAGRALPMPEGMGAGGMALAIISEPLVWALLLFAVGGMLLYTHALQHGAVGPVTAVLWIAEVIAPSAVALAILGDAVRPGWELPAITAGLVTIGAAVLLAGASGHEVTTDQPEAIAAAPRPLAISATAHPAPSRPGERVVWWGSPPIWRPPDRTPAAVAAAPMALEWTPPQPAGLGWAPQRPGADENEAPEPVRAGEPALPRWAPQHAWSDLVEPVTKRW